MSGNSSRNPRHQWLGRSMLAMLVVACLAASCGGDDDPPEASGPSTSTTRDTVDSSTTSTSGSTTTSTSATSVTATTGEPSSPEQEVIDRYIAYWEARFAANSGTPNPDDPALREYATGAQLDAVIAETQSNLDNGLALQRRDDPANIRRVTVVSIEGDRAVVQECFVDDGLVVRRDTGEAVNDTIATHNVRGELDRVDGVWRVAEARLIQRWEGVAGCAAGS
ncbi:MAG: hypothetical protein R2689_05730 [Microthrixaceae bacterium]|nr:hypothetical protein [Microthrixaceae bacterium]